MGSDLRTLTQVVADQAWEFVHASGEATAYVVEHAEAAEWKGGQNYGSWVRLLNPLTGKCAHVSVGWLHAEPGPTGSHWRFVSQPEVAT